MKKIFRQFIVFILKKEAQLVLWKYKPKIVAITGSVGKTSTKDAVYTMMHGHVNVRRSEKSYNSQIGLPLTILNIPNGWNNPFVWFVNICKGLWLFIWPHNFPEWLVLEVGVGKPGDMAETASWLKTDRVIITAIGATPVHIEFFKSKEHLVEEKSGLINTLKKDGILILNADDPIVMGMQTKTKNKIFTYGFNTEADLIASNMTLSYSENKKPEGVTFTVQRKGGDIVPVVMQGRFGKNHMYSTLAAFAVSCSLDWNIYEAIRELKNYQVPRGRMCLIPGVEGSIIIDDTYNSSPVASEAALETLKEVSSNGRKIVALGDMLELGEDSEEAHRSIGKIAKDSCNFLITVGERAKFIKAGAIEAGMQKENIFEFLNSTEAGDFLRDFIQTGDIILVKGSQGMRMERVVSAILRDVEMKDSLLVRQEKEWLDKK